MLTETQFRKIYRLSAWYDIIVTAPLATPWSFLLALDGIRAVAEAFSLPGALLVPDVFHIFFANLIGTVVIIWSFARLRLDMPKLARYDAVGRVLFSVWMVYALASGASFVLLPILIFEIIWGILQFMPVKRRIV